MLAQSHGAMPRGDHGLELSMTVGHHREPDPENFQWITYLEDLTQARFPIRPPRGPITHHHVEPDERVVSWSDGVMYLSAEARMRELRGETRVPVGDVVMGFAERVRERLDIDLDPADPTSPLRRATPEMALNAVARSMCESAAGRGELPGPVDDAAVGAVAMGIDASFCDTKIMGSYFRGNEQAGASARVGEQSVGWRMGAQAADISLKALKDLCRSRRMVEHTLGAQSALDTAHVRTDDTGERPATRASWLGQQRSQPPGGIRWRED
jgi:hypothetical protein